jgi:DNA polymerase-4
MMASPDEALKLQRPRVTADRGPRCQGRPGRTGDVTDEANDQAEPRPPKIIHVDMDAFYASVEQRDNPDLRGKLSPSVGPRARSRGRGELRSQKRRRPVGDAVGDCQAAVSGPDLHEAALRSLQGGLAADPRDSAEHTPIIEPLSLDEAYLDVTDACKAFRWRDVALASLLD